MRIAQLAIGVIMQRRSLNNRWLSEAWSAVAVVQHAGADTGVRMLTCTPERDTYLVPGLSLELYPDEDEGYFENAMAPEPKVFVKWRMHEGRAIPVMASVSYAEGTRMFDSGEAADGVPMPGEIHAWLLAYLREHYQPRSKKRAHRGPKTVDQP
ncbi:DUF3305 domain-containing protein [Massilia sp. TSP1-1-2]|uniref:DUF3305 domain-containing protein n=1 Tax=unclassified Massilia TaxID=2609279 RepID=UPI003CEBC8C4